MAAVLLRRLLSSSFEEIYPGLPVTLQVVIKTELLTSIQQEGSPNIRKKVCDIAAELSRNLIGKRLCFLPHLKVDCHEDERSSDFYGLVM